MNDTLMHETKFTTETHSNFIKSMSLWLKESYQRILPQMRFCYVPKMSSTFALHSRGDIDNV